MTEENLSDQVREIIGKMHHHANDPYVDSSEKRNIVIFAQQLAALLPPPPLPTMAEMTPEERAASEWMQCDVAGLDGAWLIIDPFDDEDHVHVIGRKGNSRILPAPFITPRPDLPGMEWAGSKRPAPTLPDGWRLADHPDHGRGVVTNLTPNRDGRVYFVIPADDPMGYDWIFCTPDELTYLEQGADQ